ncbi:MAG: hypothetical protein FH751_02510 [Firmicutes bacterium]|nr:hypothetical protein [Bacillota bacterium]
MINILPPIYKNEILYSWFIRYHTLSGNTAHMDSSRYLFGHINVRTNVYYPTHLNYFCTQLPQNRGYNINFLIDNHTILPLYLPFMSDERIDKVIQDISEGCAVGLKD